MTGAQRTRTQDIARRLADAAAVATAIAPVSTSHPELTIADAYAVQSAGRATRVAAGEVIVGHKIGLTSAAMQQMVGVDQPDYGFLTDAMVHADGTTVEARTLVAPRVEGEIAFRLGARLDDEGVTAVDVLGATDAVAVALEVIDSRIADWRISIVETIVDNASSGHAVLGAWVPLGALDLPALTMRMVVDGEHVEGRGDAVLGDPAESVAWLARALAGQGETLDAGEVVLSGALARALPVAPGSRAEATIDGLGTVTATF